MNLSGFEIYVLPNRPVKQKIVRRKRSANLRRSRSAYILPIPYCLLPIFLLPASLP